MKMRRKRRKLTRDHTRQLEGARLVMRRKKRRRNRHHQSEPFHRGMDRRKTWQLRHGHAYQHPWVQPLRRKKKVRQSHSTHATKSHQRVADPEIQVPLQKSLPHPKQHFKDWQPLEINRENQAQPAEAHHLFIHGFQVQGRGILAQFLKASLTAIHHTHRIFHLMETELTSQMTAKGQRLKNPTRQVFRRWRINHEHQAQVPLKGRRLFPSLRLIHALVIQVRLIASTVHWRHLID